MGKLATLVCWKHTSGQAASHKILSEITELLCRENKKVIDEYYCSIPTESGKIVTGVQYKIPHSYEKGIDDEIKRLLDLDYIRPSKSTWLNNIRPVIKPNGKIRLTLNLIKLNQLVVLDRYSLPNMEEMIFKLKGKKFFTKIDLKEGFYQILLKEDDRHKTAFRIKNKLYEWNRMPMGFKNSPAVFQKFMDTILMDEVEKSCFVYVDDILIFGEDMKAHDEAFKRVSNILINKGLVINREKQDLERKMCRFLDT